VAGCPEGTVSGPSDFFQSMTAGFQPSSQRDSLTDLLVTLEKSLELPVPPETVWALIRNVNQLGRLVPGVVDLQVKEVEGEEVYVTRVLDKVGPFQLELAVEIRIVEVIELKLLDAQLSGFDKGRKNRLQGNLRAELTPVETGKTRVDFLTNIEVLGKLASLGASPIRRRTDQQFSEFAKRVEQCLFAG